MTVRDGARFLEEALESLITQTDPDFEVIVVDDGSTDDTGRILAAYRDRGLIVETTPAVGRVPALQQAIRIARGQLIAILDADDVALPERLTRQRAFLGLHPEIVLVGTGAIEFDDHREWRRRVISGPTTVRRALGMYNPFIHSTIMFRRRAYEAVGGYRPDERWGPDKDWSHDKDLLIRIASRYEVDILPEALIRYRHHRAQWTSRSATESLRRRKSAHLQLRAARDLKLPLHMWIVPLMGWLYAYTPAPLRPRRFKDPVKQFLLRVLGAQGTAPGSSR